MCVGPGCHFHTLQETNIVLGVPVWDAYAYDWICPALHKMQLMKIYLSFAFLWRQRHNVECRGDMHCIVFKHRQLTRWQLKHSWLVELLFECSSLWHHAREEVALAYCGFIKAYSRTPAFSEGGCGAARCGDSVREDQSAGALLQMTPCWLQFSYHSAIKCCKFQQYLCACLGHVSEDPHEWQE